MCMHGIFFRVCFGCVKYFFVCSIKVFDVSARMCMNSECGSRFNRECIFLELLSNSSFYSAAVLPSYVSIFCFYFEFEYLIGSVTSATHTKQRKEQSVRNYLGTEKTKGAKAAIKSFCGSKSKKKIIGKRMEPFPPISLHPMQFFFATYVCGLLPAKPNESEQTYNEW